VVERWWRNRRELTKTRRAEFPETPPFYTKEEKRMLGYRYNTTEEVNFGLTIGGEMVEKWQLFISWV
jgi:hypothetical protein